MRFKFDLACSCMALLVLICLTKATPAQQHELLRGDMPPGEIAHKRLIGEPHLATALQPVRIVTPTGANVAIYSLQGFFDTGTSSPNVELKIGPVYRLRISKIEGHPNREIYPSVELIDRLYPPEGLENQFPIEIAITSSDLSHALSGRLVTKVIYLEDPQTALPYQKIKDEQPYFDVGTRQDPFSVARRLGRPMAIVRLGSRVPTYTDQPGEFEFNAPEIKLLPKADVEQNANPQFQQFDDQSRKSAQSESWTTQEIQQAGKLVAAPSAVGASDFIGARRLASRVESAAFLNPQDPETAPTAGTPPARNADFPQQDGISRSEKTSINVDRYTYGSVSGQPIVRNPHRKPAKANVPPGTFPNRVNDPEPGQPRFPVPIRRGLKQQPDSNLHPEFRPDEFVFDGADRNQRITVDQSWNIYGLDTEDTFGHFDTLDGRRLVSPSNRVAIYSPRFAAVRQMSPLGSQVRVQSLNSAADRLEMHTAGGKDFSSTTKQNEAFVLNRATQRANSFRDRTRGLKAETALRIGGFRNSYQAYENLNLVRFGRFSQGESARVSLGMQSANVWEDEVGLQVTANKAQAIIARDVNKVQQIEVVDSEGDNAVLRVVKLASRIAAKSGEEVEFTIRFDNLSRKPVGNVTLVDNLSPRLEYLEGSSQSSLKANFVTKRNDAGSLMLRWEIVDPLPGGEGGIIRFKCRVR